MRILAVCLSSLVSIGLVEPLLAQAASHSNLPECLTYRAEKTYTLPSHPVAALQGDFNGDGIADIVNLMSDSIAVSFGTLHGGFQPAKVTTGLLTGAVAFATGDFNRDGKADLVVSSSPNQITVLLSQGDGTFKAASAFAVASQEYTTYVSVAVGDINGDGIPDIVTVGNQGSPDNANSTLAIHLGNGDGTFSSGSTFSVDPFASQVSLADMNGDGRLDALVASNLFSQSGADLIYNVQLYLNSGSDLNPSPVSKTNVPYASAFTVADLNGDGRPDVAVIENPPGPPELDIPSTGVTVLLNDGTGLLSASGVFGSYLHAVEVVAADLGKSGTPDLLVAQQGGAVGVLVGDGRGGFTEGPSLPTGNGTESIIPSDFHHNGFIDLAITDFAESSFRVVQGTRACAAQPAVVESTVNGGYEIFPDKILALGNFNHDRNLDAILYDTSSESVAVMAGDGHGHFGPPVYSNFRLLVNYLVVHDINGDGTDDLAIPSSNGLWVALGKGDGTFLTPTLAGGLSMETVFASLADVNGDGKLDLIASDTHDSAYVLLGNGDGTFGAAQPIPLPGAATWQATGDFNHDGQIDFAVSTSAGIAVFLNDGFGGFTRNQVLAAAPSVVSAADMNRDGRLDLVTQSQILYGNGDGTFGARRTYTQTTNVFMQVGDLNGDGIPDIVTSNSLESISVYTGTAKGGYKLAIFSDGTKTNGYLRLGNLEGGNRLSVAVLAAVPNVVDINADNFIDVFSDLP